MDLISSIRPLLGIKSLEGSRTFTQIPVDEREKLCLDRKLDLDSVTNHVRSLIQRVDQKERLLHNYEKDLGKFRCEKFKFHLIRNRCL